jgi:hypothetical protein
MHFRDFRGQMSAAIVTDPRIACQDEALALPPYPDLFKDLPAWAVGLGFADVQNYACNPNGTGKRATLPWVIFFCFVFVTSTSARASSLRHLNVCAGDCGPISFIYKLVLDGRLRELLPKGAKSIRWLRGVLCDGLFGECSPSRPMTDEEDKLRNKAEDLDVFEHLGIANFKLGLDVYVVVPGASAEGGVSGKIIRLRALAAQPEATTQLQNAAHAHPDIHPQSRLPMLFVLNHRHYAVTTPGMSRRAFEPARLTNPHSRHWTCARDVQSFSRRC